MIVTNPKTDSVAFSLFPSLPSAAFAMLHGEIVGEKEYKGGQSVVGFGY